MLAYAFPPLGGAGVQRTLKFVKYLPEHGWDPTVVTVRWSPYQMRDPTLVGELPAGVRVLRAPELPLTPYLAMVLSRLRMERARAFVTWPDNFQGWLPGGGGACSAGDPPFPAGRPVHDLGALRQSPGRPRRCTG